MATVNKAIPITVGKVVGSSDAHPAQRRLLEDASETFKIGTPVRVIAADGMLAESPAIVDNSAPIAGFSQEPGANLTTEGTPKTLTYGSVQNQSSAVLIPVGAPPNDGKCGVNLAVDNTWFLGSIDVSGAGSDLIAATDLGLIFGLTKDAGNGFWYVDKTKTATGTGACVEIMELIDAVGTQWGKVLFRVTKAMQQFGT